MAPEAEDLDKNREIIKKTKTRNKRRRSSAEKGKPRKERERERETETEKTIPLKRGHFSPIYTKV